MSELFKTNVYRESLGDLKCKATEIRDVSMEPHSSYVVIVISIGEADVSSQRVQSNRVMTEDDCRKTMIKALMVSSQETTIKELLALLKP